MLKFWGEGDPTETSIKSHVLWTSINSGNRDLRAPAEAINQPPDLLGSSGLILSGVHSFKIGWKWDKGVKSLALFSTRKKWAQFMTGKRLRRIDTVACVAFGTEAIDAECICSAFMA